MTGDQAGSGEVEGRNGCNTTDCAANEDNRCKWRSDVKRCTQWGPDSSELLWRRLRKGAFGGHRFVRRYSVGELTIDFYCPKKRLAIELELQSGNDYHRDRIRERQMVIEYFGVSFMKVTGREIHEDMDGVLARIEEQIRRSLPGDGGLGEGAGTSN